MNDPLPGFRPTEILVETCRSPRPYRSRKSLGAEITTGLFEPREQSGLPEPSRPAGLAGPPVVSGI